MSRKENIGWTEPTIGTWTNHTKCRAHRIYKIDLQSRHSRTQDRAGFFLLGSFGFVLMSCNVNFHVVGSILHNCKSMCLLCIIWLIRSSVRSYVLRHIRLRSFAVHVYLPNLSWPLYIPFLTDTVWVVKHHQYGISAIVSVISQEIPNRVLTSRNPDPKSGAIP